MRNSMKGNTIENGPSIAYCKGASDVPAAGKIPASPQNNRRSARAAVNETADRPGEPVKGAVEITTARNLLGGQ